MICIICGKEFKPKNRKQRCCGTACGHVKGGRTIQVKEPEKCAWCGKTFMPKRSDRVTFCSRKCYYAHHSEERRQRLKRKKEQPKPTYTRICRVCGETFEAPNRARTVCSDECDMSATRAYVRKRLCPPAREFRCEECGRLYVGPKPEEVRPKGIKTREKYCSDECQVKAGRRNARHVRRARMKGVPRESVNINVLFKRDRGRCQICGEKVPRDTRSHQDPMRASIDHIIPISLGGSHTYDNCQLAHRSCNNHKRARAVGSQLRIPLECVS